MLLSIVISTFNRPEYLRNCLLAIGNGQRFGPDVEVRVVDDGSVDTIAQQNQVICDECKADYLKHDRNRGMAVGRNTGLFSSSGVWVAFLDDDVRVEPRWLERILEIIRAQPPEIVGIEGRVEPSGSGVWDREVQNRRGGSYLTCHIAFCRQLLIELGGFDPQFEFEGLFCEDHELAARVLMQGAIRFFPELAATHLPRTIVCNRYLSKARSRMRSMLNAEFYFFHKHPDRYHLFRNARTFWGTYRSILTRHILNEVRRRGICLLLSRPMQSICLLAGSLIEQIEAILCLPRFIRTSLQRGVFNLGKYIDTQGTAAAWDIPPDRVHRFLRIGFNPFRSLLFRLTRKPAYDVRRKHRQISLLRPRKDMRLFIRVDDVFLDRTSQIELLCSSFAGKGIPWLAAVTGNDLAKNEYQPQLRQLCSSGADIGLHGFSHTGRFGPFDSEILQLSFPEIDTKVRRALDSAQEWGIILSAFIPPFNAISPWQILHMARQFPVVCGGPETVRFTDGVCAAVALIDSGWYMPSLFPFYGCARTMLQQPSTINALRNCSGSLCITVHMADEARDDFGALRKLLDMLPAAASSWRIFGTASIRNGG